MGSLLFLPITEILYFSLSNIILEVCLRDSLWILHADLQDISQLTYRIYTIEF